MQQAGIETLLTREPGGTRTGELIRRILQHDHAGEPLQARAETLLFAAARAQLVGGVIAPALGRGVCVVSDRYADSTTVYQGVARGFGVEQMLNINAFAVDGVWPDLTVILDVETSESFERLSERYRANGEGHDRFEQESRDFHERVRRGYLDLARRNAKRCRVLDSAGPLEEVSREVKSLASEALRGAGFEHGELK